MAVTCDMSSDAAWTWAFEIATWKVHPTAKPTIIWYPIHLPTEVSASMVYINPHLTVANELPSTQNAGTTPSFIKAKPWKIAAKVRGRISASIQTPELIALVLGMD
jgi:hypothetical protein